MYKLKKIKIRNLFATIFLINIILLSIIIIIIFISSINSLGDFSNKKNSDNIKKQIASLMLHDVKIRGDYYSFLFGYASNASEIIAEHFAKLQKDVENSELEFDQSEKIDLILSKGGIFFNNFQFNETAFLILEKMSHLDNKHEIDLCLLNRIRSLPLSIKEYADYISDIWIITKNNTVCIYPNIYPTEGVDKWRISKEIIDHYRGIFSDRKKGKYRSIWSKFHKNAAGRLQMTLLTQIFDEDNQRIGIVGVSLSLYSILHKVLGNSDTMVNFSGDGDVDTKYIYKQFPGSFSFILDIHGDLVAFPRSMRSLFSIPENKEDNKSINLFNMKASDNPDVKDLANEMIKDLDGIYPITLHDKKYLVAFSTLSHSTWTLGVVVPEYDLMGSIRETQTLVKNTKTVILIKVISIISLILVIFVLINFFFFKKFLLKPIVDLSDDAAKIGKGNFDLKIEEKKTLEISTLATTLGNLGVEIKEYMKNLENEIKNRHAIETEVKIATEIQQSVLPSVTKDYIRNDFALFVEYYQSSNVTGDFYDFFYMDKQKSKLALVIADVSGRGVPAAFYMAVTKTVIRNTCHLREESPGEALTEVNKILCMDIKSNMFASALVIYCDLSTDRILYANAAHKGALLIKTDSGTTKHLENVYGRVLGKNFNEVYETGEIEVKNNEKVVLFTNEFIKAISAKNEKYKKSMNDFKKYLIESRELSCSELSREIDNRINEQRQIKEINGVSIMIFEKLKGDNV